MSHIESKLFGGEDYLLDYYGPWALLRGILGLSTMARIPAPLSPGHGETPSFQNPQPRPLQGSKN